MDPQNLPKGFQNVPKWVPKCPKIDTFLKPFSIPLLAPLLITFGSKKGSKNIQNGPRKRSFSERPTLQNHETVIKISPIQLSKWHPFGNPFLDPTFRTLFLLWSDLLGVHLGSILGPFFGTIFGTNFGPQKAPKKKPVLASEREARLIYADAYQKYHHILMQMRTRSIII